jgi:hypothetical protein
MRRTRAETLREKERLKQEREATPRAKLWKAESDVYELQKRVRELNLEIKNLRLLAEQQIREENAHRFRERAA